MKKKSKIISYHTTIPLNQKEDSLHRLYFSFVGKKDVIITVSKNQELFTAERYHVARKLFKTIHNGVDVSHWKPQPEDFSKKDFRARYDIPENSKVIIIAATLRPEKNHIGALKALNNLHKKHNLKAYILFIGDGIMLNELKILTEELRLNEYVKFIGYQRDVRPFYWISDLFTLCSDKVETFSIAALEAMACGLPVVLTDIGGANEMVYKEFNGLMCLPEEKDISEKWNEALNSNFDKNRIVQFVINKFNQVEMINKYENLLDNSQ